MVNLSFLSLSLLVVCVSGNVLEERQATTTTGDRQCSNLMCVTATVNGSSVEYVLSSTGKRPLGWMGMGFGRQMAGSPMIIMWANPDGTVTLSQRSAPGEVQPRLDANPPRVATLAESSTLITGNTPSFGYTIPKNTDTKQSVIYAFGTQVPSSSAPDAELLQHLEEGGFVLDLTKGASGTGTGTGDSPATHGDSPSDDIPLLPYQRLIVAHAIFCVVGFMLFLPAGSLLARYARTFTPAWFAGHWIAQFAISGPTIIVGVALGIQSVTKAGALHLNDNHKKLGIALFVLYILQCVFGATIHWVKAKTNTGRPIQNYIHAILGLLIIALSMYQVYSGFKVEWPKTTGLETFPNGVNILFYVWVAVIAALYFGGLAFLPKQFRQESENRQKRVPSDDQDMDMSETAYRDRD